MAVRAGWRFPVGVTIFVLGGEFWDKLRALFVHGARAVFPSGDPEEGGHHE